MPEGPECTRLAKQLNEKLKGKIFRDIEILSGRYTKTLPIGYEDFHHYIRNYQPVLKSVNCKGKFIWWEFDSNNIMFSTLGMTGSYKSEPNKYVRVKFTYINGSVYYCDMRNFGTLKFTNKVALEKKLKELGPDMLSNPCSLEDWVKICQRRKNKSVVSFLLDQKAISGVGNIYKSESLYLAGISPTKKIGECSPNESKRLWKAIQIVLNNAYNLGGSTISSYADLENEIGHYFDEMAAPIEIDKIRKDKTIHNHALAIDFNLKGVMVYQQSVDPFGNKIEKVSLDDDRSTWYVPTVQK